LDSAHAAAARQADKLAFLLPALCHMRGNGIHKRRREAIIGFKTKLFQSTTNFAHFSWIETLLNYGRNKGSKFRATPARLTGEFGMHEVQPMEWMTGVFYPAKHVHTTVLAGMTLDCSSWVNDMEFVSIRQDADFIFAYNSNQRKQRSLGLPTFATTTNMIVGSLPINPDFNWISGTFTLQGPSGEIRAPFPDTTVHRWMNFYMRVLGSGLAVTAK
jgi:hypothetical protein